MSRRVFKKRVAKYTAFYAVALALTATMAAGCGPEQSQRSKTNAQNDAYAQDEQAKYAPLVGRYIGTYTLPDGTVQPALLNLVLTAVVVANGSSNQSQQVPTLNGTFFICGNKNDCSSNEQDNFEAIAQFNQAYYTPGNNSLQLSSSAITATSTNTGNTQGVGISAVVNGNRLTGRVFNNLQYNSGSIDLTRVNE